MKKKLLALALALTMVLALTACGGDSKNSGDGTLPADTSGNAEQPEDVSGGDQAAANSDIAYIQDTGTLIVGMTDFAPMDYKEDGSDEWIGFDADMAKAFGESLGVAVEFLELADWDAKSMELDTKAIDVVWNGMTLTDDASQYQTVESLGELNFAVENGSAGAKQLDALNISYTAMQNQAAALMEVASGASDAAVIDRLMAGAMIGEGTSYPDLTYTVQLNDEEYGVGFRKGSDLVDAFNTWWKDMYAEGMVLEVAEIYGVQEAVKGAVEG